MRMLHKANTQQIDWHYATGNFKGTNRQALLFRGANNPGLRCIHVTANSSWRPPPPHPVCRPPGCSWGSQANGRRPREKKTTAVSALCPKRLSRAARSFIARRVSAIPAKLPHCRHQSAPLHQPGLAAVRGISFPEISEMAFGAPRRRAATPLPRTMRWGFLTAARGTEVRVGAARQLWP